jgi:hypothetical protein
MKGEQRSVTTGNFGVTHFYQKILALAGTQLVLALAIIASAAAQTDRDRAEAFRLQMEQRKRSEVMMVLDSAVALIDAGEYEAADKKLVYVLNNMKSIPSDLTFYFGKNSFFLGKYKQSIDWLNKYIQLKGTSGQFYTEAAGLLKNAEVELVKERSQNSKKVEQVFSANFDLDCGPAGKVTCPVCKGTTVIIKKGYLSNEYKTCPYCDNHGNLSCEEFNLLLRGELKPKNQ